jgi:hypothetical protein
VPKPATSSWEAVTWFTAVEGFLADLIGASAVDRSGQLPIANCQLRSQLLTASSHGESREIVHHPALGLRLAARLGYYQMLPISQAASLNSDRGRHHDVVFPVFPLSKGA